MDIIQELTKKMIEFDKGDPMRIQHFIKVHSFAKHIALEEGLDENTLLTVEAAALVHDIGILPSEKKYGKCNGSLQEQEGPAYANEMLKELNFSSDIIERVCFLVGHHHTYTKIDAIDYRILVEADFLVNLYEDNLSKEAILSAKKNIFRTKAGIEILNNMYSL